MNCWRSSVATSDDVHKPPEIDMTAQTKLTDAQSAIVKAATGRPDGNIEPLPPTLRGGARSKVIEGLIARGLITESYGGHRLNDAGYAAVGKRRPAPKGVQKMDALAAVAKGDTTDALAKHEAIVSRLISKGTQNAGTPDALQKLEAKSPTIRPGTKLAAIIDAMRNSGGTTIAQMMASTGWQAHTVRGAISGMVRKRLGYEVVTEKGADGQRAYRIA